MRMASSPCGPCVAAVLLCVTGVSASSQAATVGWLNDHQLREAALDMTLPHEAVPRGTEGADWSLAPRISYGESPPRRWNATILWGQLYEAAGGNPASNVRVQFRNLRLAVLRKSTGQWDILQDTSSFTGAYYNEDFSNNTSLPATQRPEAEGASVMLPTNAGVNFHFWPASGRVQYQLSDIDEMIALIDARLILDDPLGPDERDQARLLLGAGADYWQSLTAEWNNWTTNGDVGIGRHKFITSEWDTYTMTTLTLAELPPPPVIPEPGSVLVGLTGLTLLMRRHVSC